MLRPATTTCEKVKAGKPASALYYILYITYSVYLGVVSVSVSPNVGGVASVSVRPNIEGLVYVSVRPNVGGVVSVSVSPNE